MTEDKCSHPVGQLVVEDGSNPKKVGGTAPKFWSLTCRCLECDAKVEQDYKRLDGATVEVQE